MCSAPTLSSLTASLLLSVCLVASPSSSNSSSLWGKKVHFKGHPCLWQLNPATVQMPPLHAVSVCMLLRPANNTKWTAFEYRAPGNGRVELGLGSTGSQVFVWLLGQKHHLNSELDYLQWNSACITWSSSSNKLHLYLKTTTSHISQNLLLTPEYQHLAQNGTLTLGVSHYVDARGTVKAVEGTKFLGEISQFRIWDTRNKELFRWTCADGNVVSWDQRHWKYDCPPELDGNLNCAWAFFKIQTQTFVTWPMQQENCSESLTEITKQLLENILPRSISVATFSVDSLPRHTCNAELPQESREVLSTSCNKCFSFAVQIVVHPEANVEVFQADTFKLLSRPFSTDTMVLTTESNSIRVVPMVAADLFLRVRIQVDFTGNAMKPKEIIEQWLNEELVANTILRVWNLVIVESAWRDAQGFDVQMHFYDWLKEYTCDFHIQRLYGGNVEQFKDFINATLSSQYENDSTVIQTTNISMKQIFPQNCLEDFASTIYGEYFWPESFPQEIQEMGCRKPSSHRAHRLCKLHIENDTTTWDHPDMSECEPIVSISDLDNITVTTDNAAEVVDMIQDLINVTLGNSTQIPSAELNTVVDKLNQVVNVATVTPALGGDIVKVFSNILLSDTDVAPVAVSILDLTDTMGNTMAFLGESLSLTAPSLALSMINVDPKGFNGLTFTADSVSSSQNPNVSVIPSFDSKPIPEANATISLPSSLHNFLPPGQSNKTRIQFQFFGTQDLFQDLQTPNGTTVNSYIVSATINGSHISNLANDERVAITLRHLKAKQPNHKLLCVFWDFQEENGGQGGWSDAGCETRILSPVQTQCLCEHLTHFAVLMDVSRTPISEVDSQMLTIISYVGCGLSSIFLGITLLTYLAFPKLRCDNPSKILINLSAALLGLNMLFLVDSWLASFSNYSLCIVTAAALHYFLLASFSWMALEAIHMYFALVKIFNTYVPAYIFKFCAMGWGVPLVIISLVLLIDKDAYGNILSSTAAARTNSVDQFCWLQDNAVFYATVVAFVLLVLLANMSMFVVVLLQIRKMGPNKKEGSNSRSTLQNMRAVASLTILLGLTWVTGFFTFGPGRVVLMYLFTIFNTLQGFFVFLFHCLMKENVRKQWNMQLRCGAQKSSEHSGWSKKISGQGKKENLLKPSVNTSVPSNTSESEARVESRPCLRVSSFERKTSEE